MNDTSPNPPPAAGDPWPVGGAHPSGTTPPAAATPSPAPSPAGVSLLNILMVRLRFVFVFVVVGLIVGNWGLIKNFVDRWTRPAKVADVAEGEFEWFCPMHPSVVRKDASENCPICGMPLSRRKRGEKAELPEGVLARLQLSPFRIQQAGLATDEILPRQLVREIRTVGTIEVDERRVSRISARIAGRVDELFVKFTGEAVLKGDPVYKIYSPDLVTTQEEYLVALKSLEEIKSLPQIDAEAVARARRIADSARERLLLWGITPSQMEDLDRDRKAQTHLTIYSTISGIVAAKNVNLGHYVEVGEDPYTIADLGVVWMQAQVFERDIGLIHEGETVEITTEAHPGETFPGTVAFIQPTVESDTRTVKVRVDVENPAARLKPGMFVTALFRLPLASGQRVACACCTGSKGGAAEGAVKCPKQVVPAPPVPGAASPGPAVFYQCPMHPEVTSDKPGKCPKCGMTLKRREKSAALAPATGPRTIYVCDMHPERVFDQPGICEKCGGMKLVEKRLDADLKVVYSCPDHPEVRSDDPAFCPKDGHACAYKIVKNVPDAPAAGCGCGGAGFDVSEGLAHCPDCGMELIPVANAPVLSVPASAVIDTGVRQVVFIERGAGTFEQVQVTLGPRAGEFYQLLKGLKQGDRVVTAGAFLLDAEARLNPAAAAQYFGASGTEKK